MNGLFNLAKTGDLIAGNFYLYIRSNFQSDDALSNASNLSMNAATSYDGLSFFKAIEKLSMLFHLSLLRKDQEKVENCKNDD